MKSSFNQKRSIEKAQSYIEKRFQSRRMEKVEKAEEMFASFAASLAGTHGKVLDIPCGSGRFAGSFVQSGGVYEFDYDENMLDVARKNHSGQPCLYFAQANIAQIPLPDNSVDLAFCMRLMHHIDNVNLFNQILVELSRVSSSWVAISFYRKESWKYIRRRILKKQDSGHPISVFTFLKMVKNNGFKIKKLIFLWNNKQTLALLQKNRSHPSGSYRGVK